MQNSFLSLNLSPFRLAPASPANGSDKVTGLYRPPGGRLISGGEYDNEGDTENFFRFRYTSGPYQGVEISLTFVHLKR
jgi:hypothetical protein